MTPRPAVSLLAAIAFAACQPGSSSGPSFAPASSSSVATAEPSASAGSPAPVATDDSAASPTPALLDLTLDESGPIIEPADGPSGSAYALPATAARARDGTYVLVIVWFPAENGTPVIGLATSADAQVWTVGRDPIISDLAVGRTDPGPIPTALVQLDDGSWQLYGWAAAGPEGTRFESWRASAPEVGGPWMLDGGRVLVPGAAGSWDSQTASISSVQRTEAGFAGWYEGSPPGFSLRGDLGYATSADGLTWQKHDDPSTTSAERAQSDPVVRRGICGVGTSLAVFQPQVELAPDGYVMVFGGFGRSREQMDLFGAVSRDGVEWTCGTPEALLRPGGIPGGQGIHTIASFPYGDGRIGVLIESLGEGHSDIWLATVRLLG
jgi:hypothetical protein